MGTSCFTDFALAPTARRLLFTAQDYPGLLDLAFRSPCLAADDAKALVEAQIIKHGLDAKIEKVDTIELAGSKTFYLIYVKKTGNDKPSNFVVVDAQNGRLSPYPLPKGMLEHMKRRMAAGANFPPQHPPMPALDS
ncbi:MAG: hypothetical protein ACO2ZM_02485 [Francisellaceae bacterium]